MLQMTYLIVGHPTKATMLVRQLMGGVQLEEQVEAPGSTENALWVQMNSELNSAH